MAELKRFIPNQQLDLEQILQEAQHRWLRPTEICEILRNYLKFQLTPDPPVRPPAGSLFLFDRKALRYFRKDGHRWRKKKDGKTVKEAHEKLKAGSVDVLHCYYAHGEDNESFQRRSYWMLDGQLEHIVLVHYREIKEGYKSGISRMLPTPRPPFESFLNSFGQENSPAPAIQNSFASNSNRADWNGPTSSLEDVDSGDNSGASLTQTAFGSISHNTSLLSDGVAGIGESSRNPTDSWYPGSKLFHSAGSSLWAHGSTKHEEESMLDQKCDVAVPGGADFIIHKLTDARLDIGGKIHDIVSYSDRLITSTSIQEAPSGPKREIQVSQEHGFNSTRAPFQFYSDPQMVATFTDEVEKKSEDKDGTANNNESVELKKLDSFGRWMDKEIGVDCDDSLMASDSGNYWNAIDAENEDKEVSSLSHHMQLEIDSLGPSLSQEQLFSICDISPDWTYTGVETKVLIAGRFLGSKKHSSETKWGCMFGEIEVPAEVVIDNVIRCRTPLHAPGRVPFYVTCSNRLACSEVREFEYREKPQVIADNRAPDDELRLQIRLGKLLNIGPERKSLNCSLDCDKCKIIDNVPSTRIKTNHLTSSDILIQNLLKDRLHQWLVFKIHEEGKGPNVFDDEGLGVIHLAAALGYQWAIGPIIAAGVSPNFRDARGRTALHWASCFGREETVVALVRLGGAPGAVDDPTPSFPGGQKAADLASINGHKGIAGYLAEADLTSHLSSLNINKNVADICDVVVSAEGSIDNDSKGFSSELDADNHFLKGSLAAFRKSAHTAALIQAAFRNHLFRHKQLTKSGDNVSNDSVDLFVLDSLNKVQKSSHFEDYLHSAAKKIQKKYRGWKGRKEFLDIRSRIVKIQAHVRGHQVRKQYKKVVWSVSILEKLILRWRRKGSGLRGFRVKRSTEDASRDTKRSDDYEYLVIGRKQKCAAVDKALARVKSMVRHPEAREQYMRLVTNFEKFEIGEDENSA
ncbi:calmodulin-binding transcription activator 2 isoform X1 [Cannabis sativa]|uniref:calmodulin-binding transcription activator 2 isoform X1 n=2 Tax=Cannabis sativa TaxID=3483 RepID=UPI0029CA3328|nr:calmodulin-binding transcription activator 2 isoform X1 [Cannabis sativa]